MESSPSAARSSDGSGFSPGVNLPDSRVEFGADGIRGVANQWPLVPPVLVRIGKALGQYLLRRTNRPQVVIGRDTRASGEFILNCMVAGLTDAGVQTIDLGVITTPGVAFLVREQRVDMGVVVSASHNPYDHNGIKIIGPSGLRLGREEELEIEQLIRKYLENGFPPLTEVGQASNGHHLLELYVQDHVRFLQSYWNDRSPLRSLKLVLDCANGASQTVAPQAFRMLGATVCEVNCTQNGANINHSCGSEHLRRHPHPLLETLRAEDAQYGFAFDGDGDRLAVIDDGSHVYDGSSLLLILARFFQGRDELRHNTIVTTQLTNRAVLEALAGEGINTVLVARGDRNIEAAIWAGDYLLGGEEGGNIIINDGRHTAADAVFTALTLAGAIVKQRSLGAAMGGVTLYPQLRRSLVLGRQLALDERRHLQAAVAEIQARFAGRVLWWQSTTEAGVLRALVEGASTDRQVDLESVFQALVQAIRSLRLGEAGAQEGAHDRATHLGPHPGAQRDPTPAIARAITTPRTPTAGTARLGAAAAVPLHIEAATGIVHLGVYDITTELPPLLYRVLLCLWLQKGRPVKKDDLIEFAWREATLAEGVTDQAVAQAVSRLTRLLRKLSGGSSYIEPIRGLGGWRLYAGGLPDPGAQDDQTRGSADEQQISGNG